MPLETYNKKRDFNKTPEPAGKVEKSGGNMRYALQKHAASRLHYDLRLEWNGVLLSWVVPKGPSMNPADKRLAVHVEDHPLDYREFEGVIPKGEYGAGTVQLFDEGTWAPITDVDKGLEKGEIKFVLAGKRFRGQFVLVRIHSRDGDDKNWLLIKEKDEFVQNDSGIGGLERSVSSGRTMEEITKEGVQKDPKPDQQVPEKRTVDLKKPLPFSTATPMLASLISRAPSSAGWRHEIKYDGYRLLVFLEGDQVRMITRNGHDWTERFSGLAADFKSWKRPANMVLDGEAVFFDPFGKSDFQHLQSSLKTSKGSNLSFVAFDLLAVGDQDTRGLPLEQRQSLLAEMLENSPKSIIISPYSEGDERKLFDQLCEKGLEGIVSKKMGSTYSSDRSKDWVKSKCVLRQEFIVVGYTRSEKKRTGLSSLILAVSGDDGQLRYAGRTGTGYTEAESLDLVKQFKPYLQESASLEIPRQYRSPEKIFWMTPKLIAEVKFAEWTDDNVVRQGVFMGLREDKQPSEVKMEKEEKTEPKVEPKRKTKISQVKKPDELTIQGVRISSPDKVYDPDNNLTKGQVAEYYEAISGRMLPHLENRIVSLLRAPDGIKEQTFFFKHASGQIPYIEEVPVEEKSGQEEPYIVIKDLKGILGSVQMSAIEFHTWGSRMPKMELPDQLVFDLDPDEGLGLENIRQGVRDMRGLLDQLKLESFLKTSGGKGYHVMVPLQPNPGWESARTFAKNLAIEMTRRWPKLYTATMSKEKRKGKIFIDWIRNNRTATSVCAYSLRARAGLPISWPISWDSLDKILPNEVTIQNYQDYIDDDAWKGYLSVKQSLK